MSKLCVLDSSGHGMRAEWHGEDGVAAARAMFDRLAAEKYVMFRIDDPGNGMADGEVITVFDPQAEEILATPQIVGG